MEQKDSYNPSEISYMFKYAVDLTVKIDQIRGSGSLNRLRRHLGEVLESLRLYETYVPENVRESFNNIILGEISKMINRPS